VQVEQQILDAGAEIVWVLQTDAFLELGTAQGCRDLVNALGSTHGWCVGDADTQPMPGTFNESPFGMGRGFDIIVPRSTMVIEYTSYTGPSQDEITGEELLARIQEIADGL
jgi:hypothetical protein